MRRANHTGRLLQDDWREHVVDPLGKRLALVISPRVSRLAEARQEPIHSDVSRLGDDALDQVTDTRFIDAGLSRHEAGNRVSELDGPAWRHLRHCLHTVTRRGRNTKAVPATVIFSA